MAIQGQQAVAGAVPRRPAYVTSGTAPQAHTEDWSSPTTRQATPRERSLALLIGIAIVLITAALFPIAQEPWPQFGAFIPAYQTAIIFDYLTCAYLVLGHYRATRNNALLHLGCGCLYAGLIAAAQFLSFPGMFATQGILPGGAQTTIWLWLFWHVGPVMGMLLFAWNARGARTNTHRTPQQTTLYAIMALFLAVLGSVALVTSFHEALPVLDVGDDYSRITSSGVGPGLQLVTLLTLLVLWSLSGFRTVLQIWIGVSLVALLCDNAITMAGATHFSAGWYVGRANALVSASALLFVYLREINHVYSRTPDHARVLAAATATAPLEAEHDQARLDPLTQLPGRARFMELAQATVTQSAAEGHSVAVFYIDLDGFMPVNAARGHAQRDAVLRQTADILRKVLRDDDMAGRLGDNEFVAIITAPPHHMEAMARRVAQRLVDDIGDLGAEIGCSIGVAIEPADAMQLDQTVRHADQALYESKRRGKNGYRFYARSPASAEQAVT